MLYSLLWLILVLFNVDKKKRNQEWIFFLKLMNHGKINQNQETVLVVLRFTWYFINVVPTWSTKIMLPSTPHIGVRSIFFNNLMFYLVNSKQTWCMVGPIKIILNHLYSIRYKSLLPEGILILFFEQRGENLNICM